MLFCCLNPRLGLSMTHTPRMHITLFTHATVTYNKKQSAAVMNSLYCKCRGKGSDVTQDGPALMLSVNFVERRQTTPCCVLPAPRERRRFSPTPGPTHTSHFSSPAPGVGARGGKCNINPPPPPVLCLNMQFILTFAHDLSCHLHSPGLPFPNFTVIIH